jgi:hypothetical protein
VLEKLGNLLGAEWWKRTALLAWIATFEVIARHAITGQDPGTGMVSLIGVLIGGSVAWQGVKRATWNKDAAVFNGNDTQRRRQDDEHGAEFAG